ncbi:ROK family protein [Streptococcus sp. DD11]|uniref:ROK family protein n=1 Tax=Streptococcus sp. DD11 TaxID=1777879 RepID=UPI0024086BC4|nr:ROK family protein [Streptococcus sp. DD11]
MAEVWKGHLQNSRNALILTLGTGLGGAILLNGRPLQGQHFQAGELSFVLNHPDGSLSENWWASQASGVSFVERAAQVLDLPDRQDGKAVFEAIAGGQHPQLNRLFEQYCQDLALIVYNLHTILDLEKVLIGGGISSQPILLDGIRSAYSTIKKSSPVLDSMLSDVEIDSCAF